MITTEFVGRVAITFAFLISLAGLLGSLSVNPTFIWIGSVLLSGGFMVWLWRRWLDRWERDREIERSRPEYPKAVPDLEEQQRH